MFCTCMHLEEPKVRNEHLISVGNDVRGNPMVWIMSRLSTSTATYPLSDFTLSAACAAHPTRCRELSIHSEQLENSFSRRYFIFVPLESAIGILVLQSNSSLPVTGNQLILVQTEKLSYPTGLRGCSQMCTSLGVFKLGAAFYTMCVSLRHVCICELQFNEMDVKQSYFRNCQRFLDIGNDIDLHQISDIAVTIQIRQYILLFFLGPSILQINPIRGTIYYDLPELENDCLPVRQLRVERNTRLVVYCNARMIVYDLDQRGFDQELSTDQGELWYPCPMTTSSSTNFTVHLTSNRHIAYWRDNMRILLPLQSTMIFDSGICTSFQNHNLLIFIDHNDGAYLFNPRPALSGEELIHLVGTEGCVSGQCEQPLVYDRYVVIRSERKISVYDLEDVTLPMISLLQASIQTVALVYDVYTVTEVSEVSESTNFTTNDPINTESLPLSPIIVIIIILVIILANIAVASVYMIWKRQCNLSQ